MANPTAFVAPALPSIRAQPTARPAVRMSSEEHRPADAAISRRAALAALAAVVAGAAAGTAPASAGPAAKQSIFGYGGASSPYSYADQKLYTGTVLYKDLNEGEVAKYRNIFKESQMDLGATASAAIAGKSWEDVRSAIRLRANDLGAAAKRLSDASPSSKAATKAYNQFKASANALDWAARQKNQAKAVAAREAAAADLDKWGKVVGF